MLKDVSSFESSSKGICQKPLLASNFVDTLVSPCMAKLSLTEPMGRTSSLPALFSSVKSTQIRTFPLALGTSTLPDHNYVGTVTGEMTPCCNIESISYFTLGTNGCGILLGVLKHTGSTSGLSLIWCSVFSLPRPVKN